ncbi:TPA: hypothetical protein QDA99_006598 [Burkholderia vietnamiensis]|uniref:hypothetical protein n=1 Tax=Burkholderia vietnamiensis TaxID=60552 RepID=UPI00158C4CE4|nr:hypothetical protein [Burkholderia vietnamiensis]HDR9003039.1 hypothetical protein [Burkholderia vietnamiensis]HDR9006917.1 hypothetical protein [Burkholderia vietnamiensis]
MKPFDLEAAKRGEPIVTRDGRSVVFVAHDPSFTETHRVIVRVEGTGSPRCYLESGAYYKGDTNDLDLFMAPRKRTVYVNVYDQANPLGESQGNFAVWHESEAVARKHADKSALACAVPVEIEV